MLTLTAPPALAQAQGSYAFQESIGVNQLHITMSTEARSTVGPGFCFPGFLCSDSLGRHRVQHATSGQGLFAVHHFRDRDCLEASIGQFLVEDCSPLYVGPLWWIAVCSLGSV